MADRNEVKALLARAGVEISDALRNVDKMDDAQLEAARTRLKDIQAFFDFNGSCGAVTAADLKAFFDFNGSCGGSRVNLEGALSRAATLGTRR